jgi:membrane protein insertase Oxa1/YidC/SpoIIIJ
MPILLVVYNVIYRFQSYTNEYYVYSALSDFSVNSVSFNFYGLDLLSSKGTQGIILALLVAGIQFIQIKISLPKKKEEEK